MMEVPQWLSCGLLGVGMQVCDPGGACVNMPVCVGREAGAHACVQ